jgi:hypothetical protein
MFPHPCGAELEIAVSNGADPKSVVPDDYVIVHGGSVPLPPSGEEFSGATGPDLDAAAAAVPHGQIRVTTAGAIRAAGGTVEWDPDVSRYKTVNRQHVNIMEGGPSTFSEIRPNPLPRAQRIDGRVK